MTIRFRPMARDDVDDCVAIVAKHPVLSSRYGAAIRHLGPAWLSSLGSDGFWPTVFEEVSDSKCEVLGAGVAVFVTDDFIRDLKQRPFWIGRELTLRIARGDSPLFGNNQVRVANSCGGLNLAVWQTGVSPENLVRYEVGVAVMAAFVELFRGFLLKESVTQAESVEHVEALRRAGGLFWSCSEGFYRKVLEFDPNELVDRPHMIGLSRDLAVGSLGTWAGSMFLYQAPRLGFTRSEQRLLLAALNGATDEELSNKIGVSLFTAKKTWRSIYDRVTLCSPQLIPAGSARDNGNSERGKEKKQRLIAYLRDHPEELRPVARKLLHSRAAQTETTAV